jgi:hypothetical protein
MKKSMRKEKRARVREQKSLSRDRWLGAASGIFVAVLCSVPLALMLYALFTVDFSSNRRMMLIPVIGGLFFGMSVLFCLNLHTDIEKVAADDVLGRELQDLRLPKRVVP